MSGGENAGHENAGPGNRDRKMEDQHEREPTYSFCRTCVLQKEYA